MNRARLATLFCTVSLTTSSVVEAQTHYIRSGDTLLRISQQYGVTLQALKAANPKIRSHIIYAGDVLNIPERYSEVLVAPTTVSKSVYVVQKGDNLYRIALNHKLTLPELFAANPAYKDGRVLEIGVRLNLPLPAQANQNLAYAVGGGKMEQRQVVRAQNQLPQSSAQRGLWKWPITGHKRISSPYGERFLFGEWEFHAGIDIPAAVGTPVVAARAGKVIESSYSETTGWGRMILLEHEGGMRSRYAHLDASFVFAGQFVQRGETIGTVGSTGRTTGPHLHFGIYSPEGADNPMAYF